MMMMMIRRRLEEAIPEMRPRDVALTAPLLPSRPELGWVGTWRRENKIIV